MRRFESIVRVLVVGAILLTSIPPAAISAHSFNRPQAQTEEPAETPTLEATTTETTVATTEPTAEPDTPTPLPTDTPTVPPTEASTAPALPTLVSSPALTTQVTATATPTPTTPLAAELEANEGKPTGFHLYLPLIFKYDLPQADFTAKPVIGPVPLRVTFLNRSTYATKYVWDFGDGHTDTALNPIHTYTQAGVYTVTLVAGDGVISDTLTKAHYLTPLNLPGEESPPVPEDTPLGILSAFPSTSVLDNFNRSNGAIGSNWSGATWGYTITSNQLYNEGGGPIYWDPTSFGANQEVYVTLTHVESAVSEQDLLLKAQSNDDWGDGLIEVLYDAVGERVQVWTYTAAQDWVQRGADIPVTFANGDQFGARATASGQVEVYQNGGLLATRDVTGWPYYANGGYIGMWFIDADTSILDDFGGGVTSSAPIANFLATPLTGLTPLIVTLANYSLNANSYGWNFGDGSTSTIISPTHTYTQAGVYTVTLTASNGTITDTLTRTNYITISNPSPLANFAGTPLSGSVPLTVTFSNSSTNASSYLWKFGDNTTSTVISPTHPYTQVGVYTVTLSASNGSLTNT
ncbi:MAG: PKD domain-containing protein, partial [Chloroflexi bacterium]|nr:PKD domain-containing protein [Chloroflexota bacterium]